MTQRLTKDHLRYGSVSTLAVLLGIKASQLSAWFNTDRQINPHNLERIAEAIGISIADVNAAVIDRRNDLQRVRRINQEILKNTKEAQA